MVLSQYLPSSREREREFRSNKGYEMLRWIDNCCCWRGFTREVLGETLVIIWAKIGMVMFLLKMKI